MNATLFLLAAAAAQEPADLGSFSPGARVEIVLAGPGEAPAVGAEFAGPGGAKVKVPGFFDGRWKIRFAAAVPGAWTFTVSSPEPRLDGRRGRFVVREGPFRRGALRRAEGHVLKFADGTAWLKAELRGDWKLLDADPAGRAARVAVLDAVVAAGANSLTAVLHEAGGPSPWTGGEPPGFDRARLAEWEELFTAAESRGLVIHVVLAGAGARAGMDPERYYREMVARFGHHAGLIWNVGEEADRTLGDAEQRARAAKLKALDPYGHPVTVHRKSLESDELQVWPHLGLPQFDLASVRVGAGETSLGAPLGDFSFAVWANREKSDALAHPLPVTVDRSLVVDAADDAARLKLRSQVLYPVYLSGGGLGLGVAGGRDGLERFRAALDDFRRAHRLVASLPFAEMAPANGLVAAAGGGLCFAKPGEAYAIYLARGGEASLDLRTAEGRFRVRWVNVRGDESKEGPELAGGDWRGLGRPPYGEDVAAVVTAVR
jgi:hypothetical protein